LFINPSKMIDLYMVFEFKTGNRLNNAVIMEPSDGQLYRVTSLHNVNHYQLQGRDNVETYMDTVGLNRIQSSEACAGRDGYVVLLNADANHFIPDIIDVYNGIVKGPDEYLSRMLGEMSLEDLASIAVERADVNMVDTRGNARIDIGFAAQSHNDKSVVDGMNAPKFTKWSDKVRGVSTKETLTVSMMNAAITLSNMSAVAFDDRHASDFQGDAERSTLFSNRQAKMRGVENWSDYNCEGNTLGITGTLPSGNHVTLRPHMDLLNSRREGYDVYHGVSICYKVRYPNRRGWHWVRVSFGSYGKKCVDDFMTRYRRYYSLCTRVMDWMTDNPEVLMDGREILMHHSHPAEYVLIRARANKSVYFSIFVHTLFIIGEKTGFDRAIMLEAGFCASISTSPYRFYMESMSALQAIARGDGTNFIELFIESCLRRHGSVAGGVGYRHMPSSGSGMKKVVLYQSLVNLVRLCDNASQLEDWICGPSQGGLQGVGALIGQQLMHIFTLVGAIRDISIIETVSISRTTQTHERLSSHENIRTPGSQQELVRYMASRMKVTSCIVENSLCEFCRDLYGPRLGNDTIVKGQYLYKLTAGGKLSRVSLYKEDEIDRPIWQFDTGQYTPAVVWWENGFDYGLLGDVEIRFSNKKRKGGGLFLGA
jgi:hypothetical protein